MIVMTIFVVANVGMVPHGNRRYPWNIATMVLLSDFPGVAARGASVPGCMVSLILAMQTRLQHSSDMPRTTSITGSDECTCCR